MTNEVILDEGSYVRKGPQELETISTTLQNALTSETKHITELKTKRLASVVNVKETFRKFFYENDVYASGKCYLVLLGKQCPADQSACYLEDGRQKAEKGSHSNCRVCSDCSWR